MNRNACKFGIVSAMVVVASVTATLLIERHAQWQWGEQQKLLREQAGKVAELAAENQRLRGVVAQPTNTVLSKDEFRELLRLRGEIGLLRQSALEAAALQLTHRELLAAVKSREMPQDRPALAYSGRRRN